MIMLKKNNPPVIRKNRTVRGILNELPNYTLKKKYHYGSNSNICDDKNL